MLVTVIGGKTVTIALQCNYLDSREKKAIKVIEKRIKIKSRKGKEWEIE